MSKQLSVQEMLDRLKAEADAGNLDGWDESFIPSVYSQAAKKGGTSSLSGKQVYMIEKIYKERIGSDE